MKKLYVYADFDWIVKHGGKSGRDARRYRISPVLVGELGCDSIRGSESYSFRFDNGWLAKYGGIFLSDDLNNYPGWQFARPGKDIFGCFADALPDRWGMTLLHRREQVEAIEENRPVRRLSSFDYLTGIDDFSRMGGFRFKEDPAGEFINTGESLRIPPLSDIRELIAAGNEIERREEENVLPEKKWLLQLIRPGTSLGGARPKANVINDDGALCMAKFPSRKDDYDVGLWEHFSHLLASKAGINAAKTEAVDTGGQYHTLLSRRFDRTPEGGRIHFASAMTLAGLVDGDNASTGHGYLDIVDLIVRYCTDVRYNLEELFRRAAFNICIGNSDDHFRNHGFLLTSKGWTLSPAYDINPSLNEYQSLLISRSTNKADLGILLNACEDYMLQRHTAEKILSEVSAAVKDWPHLAADLHIPSREIAVFSPVLNSRSSLNDNICVDG